MENVEWFETKQANWVPACGGIEKPFLSRSGIRMLYCWNTANGNHAYINMDTDIIMTDEEAGYALGLYRQG